MLPALDRFPVAAKLDNVRGLLLSCFHLCDISQFKMLQRRTKLYFEQSCGKFPAAVWILCACCGQPNAKRQSYCGQHRRKHLQCFCKLSCWNKQEEETAGHLAASQCILMDLCSLFFLWFNLKCCEKLVPEQQLVCITSWVILPSHIEGRYESRQLTLQFLRNVRVPRNTRQASPALQSWNLDCPPVEFASTSVHKVVMKEARANLLNTNRWTTVEHKQVKDLLA